MKVSIISPIYKGKQYIRQLIEQVETCKRVVGSDVEVELVLSNDYPEEPLSAQESNLISIVVLNAECNGGIQQARIRGLAGATGDFITFLDQDDILFPEYIKSQLESIGTADAVVCRTINEGKLTYNASMPFEEVITREYMLTKGDPIVSTGSVMIKKESVPKEWKENLLKVSGADDYFLWLCMLATGCTFALNQEVLFERVVNGMNTSLNTYRMLESEHEMFSTIKQIKLFKGKEVQMLDSLERAIYQRQLKLLDKFRLMFFALNDILSLQENGVVLDDFLMREGIRNLAIYGAGYIGTRIYGILKNTDINVKCFVDQNADYLKTPIMVCRKENIPLVDGILITMVQGTSGLKKELEQMYPNLKIIELEKLINR